MKGSAKEPSKFLIWALASILLIFGVFLSINLVRIASAVYSGAQELEPNIYVPLSVTIFTATIGLIATLYTQNIARKREIEAAHRERKLSIYLEFMEIVESILLSTKEELDIPPPSQNELAVKLIKIRTKAVLWGSPRVLKALSAFSKSKGTYELLQVMDDIQRAMREDLGLSNSGLDRNFFITLNLNDPNELDKIKEPN